MVGRMSARTLPATDEIWGWLAQVPDPEIPVISIVDLGIIRDVDWKEDTLVVTVTPTYSGCPATSVINLDIAAALRAQGVEKLHIKRALAPPWTTDWISAEGREKLRAYGIAPPIDGTAADGLISKRIKRLATDANFEVSCPRCGSAHTELISNFGSTPCKASRRCKTCLEPFDYFKCI